MTSQTPDMQAVLERLEKLDKQNRSLKRARLLCGPSAATVRPVRFFCSFLYVSQDRIIQL